MGSVWKSVPVWVLKFLVVNSECLTCTPEVQKPVPTIVPVPGTAHRGPLNTESDQSE